MKNLSFIMLLVLLLAGCGLSSKENSSAEMPSISEVSLKNHLVKLASDEFQGRKPPKS